MQQPNSSQTNAIKHFWDRYIELITKNGVKGNITRWYVMRVEQYIKAVPGKRIAEHGPEDVITHLKNLGRTGSITAWQLRQSVDAMQNMLTMLEVPWLQEVDWQIRSIQNCLKERELNKCRILRWNFAHIQGVKAFSYC